MVAGLIGSPQDWTVLLGLTACYALAALIYRRFGGLAQVLFCLACMPIWVGSVDDWQGWLLGLCALVIFILAWPDRAQRRVGLLMLLLGTVEALRLFMLGGVGGNSLAGGLVLYGLMGAGIWSGCSIPRAAWRGGLLLLGVFGVRFLWVVAQGEEASLKDRAGWGLRFEDRALLAPEEGLALIAEGYQTTALVQVLLNHYSIEELMEAGLVPRADQLGVADVITAARWLERVGEGGGARRLLLQVATDGEACWWANLFSRIQAQQETDCSRRRPQEVPSLEGELSLEWPGTTDQLQIELDLPERITHLELQAKPGSGSLRWSMNHGSWSQAFPEEDGWSVVMGPLQAGPLRLQVQHLGLSPPPTISLRAP